VGFLYVGFMSLFQGKYRGRATMAATAEPLRDAQRAA
jgi:hypothetical protein